MGLATIIITVSRADLTLGTRVVVNPTLHCGKCRRCRDGQLNFCERKSGQEVGVDRDGTMAPFVLLPEALVEPIPPEMRWEHAALIEPLACVLNYAEGAGLRNDDRVAILGAGPVGLTWATLARPRAVSVTVIDPDLQRLQTAHALGFQAVLPGHAPTAASLVVETSGTAAGLESALQIADVDARICLMGFDSRTEVMLRPLEITMRGLRIIGRGDYNSSRFAAAVQVARGLPLERLVTHRVDLVDFEAGFELLSGGAGGYGATKVLVTC